MNLSLPNIVGGDKEKKKKGSACVYLTEEQCRFPCRKVRSKRSNGKGKCRTRFSSRKKYKEVKVETEKKKRGKKRRSSKATGSQVTDDLNVTDITLQPRNTPQPGEDNFVPEEVKESEPVVTVEPVVSSEEPVSEDPVSEEPASEESAVSKEPVLPEEADGDKVETGNDAGPSFLTKITDTVKDTVEGFITPKTEGEEVVKEGDEVKGGKKRKRSRRRSKKSSCKKSSRKK